MAPVGLIVPYSSTTWYDALFRFASVILPLMVTGVMVLFGDHSSVIGLAVAVTTGANVSLTVTVNVFVEELRAASVAVQVTVDVPIANVDPEAGAQDTEAPTASVAEGVP